MLCLDPLVEPKVPTNLMNILDLENELGQLMKQDKLSLLPHNRSILTRTIESRQIVLQVARKEVGAGQAVVNLYKKIRYFKTQLNNIGSNQQMDKDKV